MLAPYALRAEESRGRRYPEEAHAYRNAFQRDRDRVVHSRAFRRLENKTRIIPNTIDTISGPIEMPRTLCTG